MASSRRTKPRVVWPSAPGSRTAWARSPRWRSAWPAAPPTRSSRPTDRCAPWPSRPSARCPGWLGWDNSTTTPGSRWAASSSEQAHDAPQGEFLLFDGRVHTYEAVNRRINNVVRGLIDVGVRQGDRVGVLMETRPSALVAIAALSRLGARRGPDAARRRSGRTGPPRRGVARSSPTPATSRPPGSCRGRCWCWAVASPATLQLPEDAGRHRHGADRSGRGASCPPGTGPTRVSPGTWRSSRSTPSAANWSPSRSPTSGGRCRRSAPRRRPPSTASDTVYCLTPLHHQSGLLVSLGGAVVGGTRIALSRGLRPDRFVPKFGSTASPSSPTRGRCCATWSTTRRFGCTATIRCGCSSAPACRPGCGSASIEAFAPAHVVEFFATTDGQAVLANVSGAKIGSKGRPLPGGGHVELAAYDADDDLILEDDRGFVQLAEPNEVGVLLAQSARADRSDRVGQARGVRARRHLGVHRVPVPPRRGRRLLAGRQPRLGDPHRRAGPVYRRAGQRRARAGSARSIWRSPTGSSVGDRELAVSALTLRPGRQLPTADLNEAWPALPVGLRRPTSCTWCRT